MMRAALKLLLLSWAVTVRMEDEFEEPEDARSVPPKTEIVQLPQPFEEVLRQPKESRTEFAAQGGSQQLKESTALLLETMEACRESHPSLSNQTFNLQLYGGLLNELLGVESEATKAALRRCNISEELVGKLKAKLSQLDIFQDVFVLIPRNNSSESPEHGKTTQQPNPPASRVYSQRTVQTTALENNLKLKLGDEWIHVEPKVSHLSHIYLGSSIYPILTEESRVLDKGVPISTPAPTEGSFTRETQVSSGWLNDFVPASRAMPRRKMHRLESSPQQRETTAENLLRLPRGLQKTAPAATAHNRLSTPATDAPHRLSLLPRNSHRWHTREGGQGKKPAKHPLDLNDCAEDPHYRMIHKLCSAILQHLRKFLNIEVLRQSMKNQD